MRPIPLTLAVILVTASHGFGAAKAPGQSSEARFKQLDRDRSGKLSIKELWPAVKGQLSAEQTKSLFKGLDKNNDNEVEEHEFKRLKQVMEWVKAGKDPVEELKKLREKKTKDAEQDGKKDKKKKRPAKKPADDA